MSWRSAMSPLGAVRRSMLIRSISRWSKRRSRCHGPLIVTRTSSIRSETSTRSSGSVYDTPIRAVISLSLSVLTSRNTVTASTIDRNLRPTLSNSALWIHRRNRPRSGGGSVGGNGVCDPFFGMRLVRAGARPSEPSVSDRLRISRSPLRSAGCRRRCSRAPCRPRRQPLPPRPSSRRARRRTARRARAAASRARGRVRSSP